MSIVTNVTSFFVSPIAKVLGTVLAISLALNAFLFWQVQHQVAKKVECITAVKATNQIATDKKKVVETRQEGVTNETQDRITRRISTATGSLLNESRKSNLPESSGTTEGSSTEGGTSVVLPRGQYESDKRICVTNTILAEEWQNYYGQLIKIREEENVSYIDPQDSSLHRISRRTDLVDLQGQRGYLDLGDGSNELVRPSGVSEVLQKAIFSARSS